MRDRARVGRAVAVVFVFVFVVLVVVLARRIASTRDSRGDDEDGRTASEGTIGRRAVRMRERDERADGGWGRGEEVEEEGEEERWRYAEETDALSIEARGWRRGDSGRRRGRRTRRSTRRFERCER